MNNTVFSRPDCIWCDRVKTLLKENSIEFQEIYFEREGMKLIEERYKVTVRSVPQVILDGEFVGGFKEVESRLKGIKSINGI